MIGATLGLALILAQSPAAGQGIERVAQTSEPLASCGNPGCGALREIVRLQRSPSRRDRERAAMVLRQVDWRRHPEILGALAFTLLHDPVGEVREEAAESLTRLGACVPVVHEALRRAANDPDRGTRRWALRGLQVVSHRCVLACSVCDPLTAGRVEVPGPIVEEPALGRDPGPGTILEPIVLDEPALEPEPRPRAEPGPPLESPSLPSSVEEIAPRIEPEPPAERVPDATPEPRPPVPAPRAVRREPTRPRFLVVPPRPRVAIVLPRIVLPRVEW